MRVSATFRKVAAVLSMASLAMVGLIPAAVADDGAGTTTQPAPTITKETGTVTIHKRLRPEKLDENYKPMTGEDGATITTDPVEGVVFTAYPVHLTHKLNTNRGWVEASKIIQEFQKNPTKLPPYGEGITFAATDVDGKSVKDLAVGLYIIRETGYTDPKVKGEPIKVLPGAPFLITVPMLNSAGNSWNYNIHLYPKNAALNISKKVEDKFVNVGTKLKYTIKAEIPPIEKGRKITKFEVRDEPEKGVLFRNEPGDVTLSIEGVSTELKEGVHYTVVLEKPQDPTNPDIVVAKFTQAGIDELNKRPASATPGHVVMVVLMSVSTAPATHNDGVLRNKASFTVSTDYMDEPTTPSVPVESKYGKIHIVKKDATTGTKLAGAHFKLTFCKDPNKAPLVAVVGGKVVNDFVTNSDGEVLIEDVRLSTFADGKPLTGDAIEDYCLYETQAPEGYQLPVEPKQIRLSEEYMKTAYEAEIPNVLENGGVKLPFTGSQALGALTAVGAALVLGSVILLGGRRRQTT